MVHKINGERVRSNFVCQILNPCSRVIFIVIWSSLRRVWPLPRMRAIRSCLVSPCQRERSKSKWICWTPAELEKGRASVKYFDSEISRDFSDFQLKKRQMTCYRRVKCERKLDTFDLGTLPWFPWKNDIKHFCKKKEAKVKWELRLGPAAG